MPGHDFPKVHHDGEEEQRFDVKHEEQKGEQVVAHLELNSCVADGFHAAFVWCHLVLGVLGAVPEQEPRDGCRRCDKRAQEKEN